ncbi:hypothetical protein EN12_23595 [Vibrio cholerae]|nr:hypothetical protein EN12_23595 [Vibrio cholerae]
MMQHYRIKDVFEISRGRVISKEDMVENGKYPVYSSQTLSDGVIGYLNSYDFSGDYLTWTTDGACAGTVFKRHGSFNCTNVCGILKAKVPIDLSYAYLAVSIVAKENKREDIIGGKLMSNEMANLVISLPELSEQSCISGDIINKKNLINSQIEKLTQKLHHLEEYKTALIHNAVTKGLDANGNPLLVNDELMECRIKDVFNINSGASINADLIDKSKAIGNTMVFGANGVIGTTRLLPNNFEKILVGRVGSAGEVNLCKGAFYASDNVLVLSPNQNITLEYGFFAIKSLDNEDIISRTANPLLTGSSLKLKKIYVPSLSGQDKIISYIKDMVEIVGKRKDLISKKIALLLEYKKSLINEAVSGKQKE